MIPPTQNQVPDDGPDPHDAPLIDAVCSQCRKPARVATPADSLRARFVAHYVHTDGTALCRSFNARGIGRSWPDNTNRTPLADTPAYYPDPVDHHAGHRLDRPRQVLKSDGLIDGDWRYATPEQCRNTDGFGIWIGAGDILVCPFCGLDCTPRNG